MQTNTNYSIALDCSVNNAVLFPPKLKERVINILREEHKLDVNSLKHSSCIGVMLNEQQMWVSECQLLEAI